MNYVCYSQFDSEIEIEIAILGSFHFSLKIDTLKQYNIIFFGRIYI